MFEKNYAKLNKAQKQAVDTIDGPVMVVAGPGTGKTQLLSMRVANILKKTDTLPNNILCLTFTESGAMAMRERLVSLIGQSAYGVAVHTFHSFGTEVINNFGDYFYRGAHFRPADELSSYEVLRDIFDKLPHDNPFASKMNDEYTALRDAQNAISHIKKSGLTPDELLKVLDHNEAFMLYAQPILQQAFAGKITKKTIPTLNDTLYELEKYQETPAPVMGYSTLSELASHSFARAIAEAETAGTPPITAWKRQWLEKNEAGDLVFKDQKRNTKLRALAGIYYDYLVAMQERSLYDFDDMILRVTHALEVFSELRLNLQEQYQYILVDEFQDTNGAQMRLLWNLTNNEVTNGRPNILVVGDDDQAIYRFQGADISNILSFKDLYRDPKVVTLTDNYRSTSRILDCARSIITQGTERLENTLEGLNKTLKAHNKKDATTVELHQLPTESDEYFWIAEQIKKELASGTPAHEIAVIGRNHAELRRILPYLHHSGIPCTYEKQDNVLESPPVVLLELLSRVVVALGDQRFHNVNALLPELLSHPAWGIKPAALWQLSMTAAKDRRFWLEIMLETPGKLKDIAEWLIVISHVALHEPLELMLDRLIGSEEVQAADTEQAEDEPFTEGVHEEFTSPLRAYFFPSNGLEGSAERYIAYLSALTTIRRKLREYRPDATLLLRDFCEFVALHQRVGIVIAATNEFQSQTQCVQVMTAHKSKGLEFDCVFIMNSSDHIWGAKSRGRAGSIVFPHNLPLAPAGDNDDERIRLLYVAMTRAKHTLHLSCHNTTNGGKEAMLVSYAHVPELQPQAHTEVKTNNELVQAATIIWHEQLTALPQADMKTLLTPTLKRYKLSATHLNNFVDIARGGPHLYLLQNLLRFPQALSPSAAFGTAIHGALQRAHTHLAANGKKRPIEDVLHDFEELLHAQQLSSRDLQFMLQKGSDVLQAFLNKRYESFNDFQVAERDFASQGVVVEGAHLTGKLDLLQINDENRTITVTDYKTGKPVPNWRGVGDFEKMKLHKFKQQLMLYKLLVEYSRDFGGKYTVDRGVIEFVEPTKTGDIIRLEYEYDAEELTRFKQLIGAVWQCIQNLDLPDTSEYEQTYKGMLAFEEDLLAKHSHLLKL